MNRPFLQIASSPQPIFDGLNVVTWKMTLHNDVTAATAVNIIPGVLYVFIIAQDGTGGRVFAWPSNVFNGPQVSLSPGSVTVQCFVGRLGNLMYANLPGAMQ
jgi:hypothetical protein